MMRRLVRIRPKFWWHNPDVLRCTISGVQSENSGVMLPKFRPDLNLASRQNTRCLEDKTTIAIHLCKNGFVAGYEVWKFHDESGTRVIAEDEHDYDTGVDRMDEMHKAIQAEVTEDPPTTEVEAFFKLLKASEEQLLVD
jgi:hypothetical protein